MGKRERRKNNFAAVRAMSSEEKSAASRLICQRIRELPEFAGAETVFSFLPLPSEPDLTSLFDSSKRWCFSRVLSDDSMEFRVMSDLSLALKGAFNIREPDPTRCERVVPEAADLIIVPGVGFDLESGSRLGRGKGHYDRYLSQVPSQTIFIGVCFACQLCNIEAEEHDVPMDVVVSG